MAIVYCGPSMGQEFIETSPLLLPFGLVLREGFLIVTLVLIPCAVAVAHNGACVGFAAGLWEMDSGDLRT